MIALLLSCIDYWDPQDTLTSCCISALQAGTAEGGNFLKKKKKSCSYLVVRKEDDSSVYCNWGRKGRRESF